MSAGAMLSDIEISRNTPLRPIEEIAAALDIPAAAVYRYGPFKAKLEAGFVAEARARPHGRLVLVTAISPTPAGEGKTTTTIGLGDAMSLLGKRVMICLREPSLGPCFGAKGGATGGGRAQIAPMDEINLHFTGDLHAISAATNLLAAMIDNHLYWGNALNIDPRKIVWRRALDLNERALRRVVLGLDDGTVREAAFDITAASETMAIFCLARDLAELEARLGRIIVAETRDKKPVTAADLGAAGPMTVLLKDALQPNLVQTLEHTPALVHGGPFANIAHGCNSLIATETGLGLADWVVTEAGFGADLGAEKFLDIKCRIGGLTPEAVVLVATIRALKMHGGIARGDLGREDAAAVARGAANLVRHVENLRKFGLPVVVALNAFTGDSAAEFAVVEGICAGLGVEVHVCGHWAEGGQGAVDLANAVVRLVEGGSARFKPLYGDTLSLAAKVETIAAELYGAAGVRYSPGAAKRLAQIEAAGYGHLPVCIAKTQYSFSTDATAVGAPSGHTVEIGEVRLSAGAGFVVALAGEIRTMPGLPRRPAAEGMGVDAEGRIFGLS